MNMIFRPVSIEYVAIERTVSRGKVCYRECCVDRFFTFFYFIFIFFTNEVSVSTERFWYRVNRDDRKVVSKVVLW